MCDTIFPENDKSVPRSNDLRKAFSLLILCYFKTQYRLWLQDISYSNKRRVRAKYMICLIAHCNPAYAMNPLLQIVSAQLNRNSSWEWQSNQLDHPHHHHQSNLYGTSRQPWKLIFGRQPYFDQTRWNMMKKIGFTCPPPKPRGDANLRPAQQQRILTQFLKTIQINLY